MHMWQKYKQYIIFPLAALIVGAIAALITNGNFKMFDEIAKPPLSPPPFIFPLAWSVLYILMGIGVALVYTKTGTVSSLYKIQLFVNFIWPIIFFNMRAYLFAFVWLILLLVLVLMMTFDFRTVSKKAAYLQIPYILWLLFAGYLNCGIWLLN